MIYSLIISDNFDFVLNLINNLDELNLNITVKAISNTTSKTYKLLDNKYFDLIFLDKNMVGLYQKSFFIKHNVIMLSAKDLFNCSTLKNYLHSFKRNLAPEIVREKIIKELTYIGYNFKYTGTHYLLQVIQELYFRQNDLIDNLQGHIYPIVANELHKSIKSIKNGIINATECMYRDCDLTTVKDYFDFSCDTKPTIKQVTSAVLLRLCG